MSELEETIIDDPDDVLIDTDVEPAARSRKAEVAAQLADVKREPGAAKPDPILVAEGITRAFGGLVAVDVQRLELQRGAITALIGPNGAGKTTFFNLLTGFDSPSQGNWSFEGTTLNGMPAYKVARAGMVRTFQLTKALSLLTVLENMRLGAKAQRGEKLLASMFRPLWKSQEDEVTRRADELLARFKLDAKRGDFAGSLSGGQRKLLEMARALMMDPTMVMLDEPMAGVNPALTQSLLQHIERLRNEGMTVLFVEHDMDMVQEISDWVVVMAQGSIVAEGPPNEVMRNPAVIEAYLGGHHGDSLAEESNPVLAMMDEELPTVDELPASDEQSANHDALENEEEADRG